MRKDASWVLIRIRFISQSHQNVQLFFFGLRRRSLDRVHGCLRTRGLLIVQCISEPLVCQMTVPVVSLGISWLSPILVDHWPGFDDYYEVDLLVRAVASIDGVHHGP